MPFFNGIQTPGFFNLTVCLNADEARNNAAKGHTPVCGTVPNKQGVSQPENDRHYTPGSCGIHFTQIQPKSSSGKDINPLDQWQLAITIIDGAKKVGETIAGRLKEAGVETCVFDRGGFLYHGRVKALADAAREAGLKL